MTLAGAWACTRHGCARIRQKEHSVSFHYSIAFLLLSAAFAQRPPATETPGIPPGGEKPAAPIPGPVPPESSSVTDHELSLDGKPLRYSATAGTLVINGDDDKPY